MAKNNLDERQRQTQTKIGCRAFYVMITVCLVLQLWDLFFSEVGIIGARELSIVFWSGMLTYLAGTIKEGIWDSQFPIGLKASLFFAFCFSGIMTIAYWAILIVQKQPGENKPINQMAGICFLILFAAGFCIYYLIGYLTSRGLKKNEKKYIDDL